MVVVKKKFVLYSVEIGSENHLVCYIYIYISFTFQVQ